ncbi:MAG: HU family DNA-binding protein [Flavobacteriaceae bacterium]|nr:HU family DNA-binding protein [Flavobacteriaceae bacterium]MCY4216162.1 HU family DNA-binding protein [Flavobacteriaceae bacterium]MCY4254145.1 HU family DNA-binding protein [Flavobacteriaceae bacterium]
MKKSELVDAIAGDAGITKSQANAALDSVFSNITSAISNGQRVTILGFGSFSKSHRPARKGRNPQTGQEIDIPAQNVARFTSSANLKKSLN